MTNVEALKEIYKKIGGRAATVADETTILGVLNAILVFYDEAAVPAKDNASALAAIAEAYPSYTLKTKRITANGTYNAASDNAYGYSQVTVSVANSNTEPTPGG